MFLAGKTESKLSLRYFTKRIQDVWLIIATGLPSLLRQGLTSLSGLVLNHQAAVYGDAAVAAMSIVNRISGFIFSLGLGMGQGYQPVAAFNYGAGSYSRVRKGFWFTALAGEVLLGIAAVGCFLFAKPMIALFQSDAEVVAMGTPALLYQSIACLFLPLSVCANMMFQSVGCAGRALLLSSMRSGLFFLPLIAVLPGFLGLLGIQIAQPISDVLSFALSLPLALQFMHQLPKDRLAAA